MLKYLLIIILNGYNEDNIILQQFQTKKQCEAARLHIINFNSILGQYDRLSFHTKCVETEPEKK